MENSVMLDGSVFLNHEAVMEIEELLMTDSEITIYAPESLSKFVLEEADEYYDYRKSSTLTYFKTDDPPSLQSLRKLFQSERLSEFNIKESNAQFESVDLSSKIRDSSSYYNRYPGYETLLKILTEEVHYLYSHSIISAVKEKIVELLRRIQAVTVYAGEEITRGAVSTQNFYHDHQEEFVNLFKWTLIGIPLTQTEPLEGLLAFIFGAALGDKIVAVLDP
jgi:hypothetical protein